MENGNENSLTEWIDYVFDHPVAVAEPEWYWSLDVPEFDEPPSKIAEYIAETFEQSGRLLARFSDGQLNQGFWYLVSISGSNFMHTLIEPAVPLPLRLRALRSFVPVFEQVMAIRCSQHLLHFRLEEGSTNALNSACYMWWDLIPIDGAPQNPAREYFDAEVLTVMERILAIPHDACRESALHGLGHWATCYPEARNIIATFLSHSPGVRRELVAYAKRAKAGMVQ